MALIVNGERVEDETIRQEAERMRPEYEKAFADDPPAQREARLQEWARENTIERVLLRQRAKADRRPIPADDLEPALRQIRERYGLPDEADDPALRAEVELDLRVRRLLDDACKDLPAPSDEAVRQYYDEHRDEFAVPEQVHAAHIVKHVSATTPPEVAEAAALKAKEALDAGADFAETAVKHSDCPENGGDLGWFPKGQMVEEFEHVVFKMRPGEVSRVFVTRFGFHVAKVHDRKPAGHYSLEDVGDPIRGQLNDQARNAAVEKLLDGLRDEAKVEDA